MQIVTRRPCLFLAHGRGWREVHRRRGWVPRLAGLGVSRLPRVGQYLERTAAVKRGQPSFSNELTRALLRAPAPTTHLADVKVLRLELLLPVPQSLQLGVMQVAEVASEIRVAEIQLGESAARIPLGKDVQRAEWGEWRFRSGRRTAAKKRAAPIPPRRTHFPGNIS